MFHIFHAQKPPDERDNLKTSLLVNFLLAKWINSRSWDFSRGEEKQGLPACFARDNSARRLLRICSPVLPRVRIRGLFSNSLFRDTTRRRASSDPSVKSCEQEKSSSRWFIVISFTITPPWLICKRCRYRATDRKVRENCRVEGRYVVHSFLTRSYGRIFQLDTTSKMISF